MSDVQSMVGERLLLSPVETAGIAWYRSLESLRFARYGRTAIDPARTESAYFADLCSTSS